MELVLRVMRVCVEIGWEDCWGGGGDEKCVEGEGWSFGFGSFGLVSKVLIELFFVLGFLLFLVRLFLYGEVYLIGV